MKEYVKRMITERDDLRGKINRAKKAIENPPYGSDKEGIELLKEQTGHMEKYLEVLERRIKREG